MDNRSVSARLEKEFAHDTAPVIPGIQHSAFPLVFTYKYKYIIYNVMIIIN